jgi:Rieske Fe-S protein
VTVALDVDLDDLVVGTPSEIPFTVTSGNDTLEGSTWLVKQASGDLIAFDPRCTHGLCAYEWSPELARFQCFCHEGRFALDGTVLSGPPPRALDRFPVRETATGIEIDVPSSFRTPRESLPT